MQTDLNRPISDKDFLRWKLGRDLERILGTYRNREIGLRLLAEKTGLSEKTLKRIQSESSDPHANTLRAFYLYFFKMIQIGEEEAADYQLIRSIVEKETMTFNGRSGDEDLRQVMASDPIFRQVFLLSRTGLVLRSEIERSFGLYGLKIIDLMLKHDVIIEVDKHVYKEGPVTVSKNGEIIKKVILECISANLDAEALNERGMNTAFYAVEGITPAAREQLLCRIDEIKQEIFNILADPAAKGEERIFVTMAMDTLQSLGQPNSKGDLQ
ncbi:MAG: hypothetical protein A2X86_03160 [Bdellovibrionales bacterium GWA2_49_15]|nr:MAG: hypothetical protein A2X86_03160 [Bdellovibrionales bacterium GWA2_49_15]HAZ12213.1 hypothetical protein [Bdellovibrionales bacterium]